MKITFKATIVCLFSAGCLLNRGASFGQDTANQANEGVTGAAFEQALKNYEAYKQKEQEEVAKKISVSLKRLTEEWVDQARMRQENLLGTRLQQKWEKLSLYFPISPSHYEYYLRGYKYTVIRNDVSKSDSITSPYKATASIKEELYVERNHSPDISDANPYFYTVTTVFNLNFEYRQNNLELIHTDNKVTNIENTAPEEIKKRTL